MMRFVPLEKHRSIVCSRKAAQVSQLSVKELTVQYWDCGLCLPVHDERGPSGQCTIHEILWSCVPCRISVIDPVLPLRLLQSGPSLQHLRGYSFATTIVTI